MVLREALEKLRVKVMQAITKKNRRGWDLPLIGMKFMVTKDSGRFFIRETIS